MKQGRGFTVPIIIIDELAYFNLKKVLYKLKNKSKYKSLKCYRYFRKS